MAQHDYGELLQSALDYGRRGFPVFPVRARGKEPLTRHGFHDATTDPMKIRQLWRRWPDANVGLPIPDGFVVLDVDSMDALHRLHAEGLEIPATVRAATGRGWHFWFSTGHVKVTNDRGLFPGVDLRGPGGYVIVPPSIHVTGVVYTWEVELRRSFIAECPPWMFERLTSKSRGRSPEDWHRQLRETIPQGQRNQTLTSVAGFLFCKLPPRIAAELAYCWAKTRTSPPLSDQEIIKTLDSIAGRELQKRRGRA